ncbi:MAG TPA: hypothetical protein VHE55_04340 [Fimbriimonadaceae bacterium]|nr:hypothetical protein [Fimbriimonadaceae bacterium]
MQTLRLSLAGAFGAQIGGPTPVRDADEIRLGQCVMTFRSRAVTRHPGRGKRP